MSETKRHLGKMRNTDQRVAVVFMQLPEDPGFALVISLENLPMAVGDSVLDAINSSEGQREPVLANVLSRKSSNSGAGSLLGELHQRALLQRVSVDDVLMTPTTTRAIPLREILTHMQTAMPVPPAGTDVTEQRNRFQANEDAQKADQRRGQALTLIREAEDFEFMARQKRNQALQVDPSLGGEAKEAIDPVMVSTEVAE